MDRLYVVTRADLPPGAQLAQSCHAVSAFAVQHPEEHRAWHEQGQNLVVLSVRDLDALEDLLTTLEDHSGYPCSCFFEPDFGGSLTAFAVSEAARERLSSLPLALRAPRQAA